MQPQRPCETEVPIDERIDPIASAGQIAARRIAHDGPCPLALAVHMEEIVGGDGTTSPAGIATWRCWRPSGCPKHRQERGQKRITGPAAESGPELPSPFCKRDRGSVSGTDSSNPSSSCGEMLWGRRRGDGTINRCKEATDGVPYAPAERLEQVPRRPGPK